MTTGWPSGLLQDDERKLSRWLATRPDAIYQLRKNMTQDIIAMAREAGLIVVTGIDVGPGTSISVPMGSWGVKEIERLVELVRDAERNKLASWMIAQGYATGHGETMEGLLEELEREVGFDKAELWIKRINDAVPRDWLTSSGSEPE